MLYAVAQGRQTGVFRSRYHAVNQTRGFADAKWKECATRREARDYVHQHVRTIDVWTDGAASNNGYEDAEAGYAAFFPEQDYWHEVRVCGHLDGELQTNNRAELFAIIAAVRQARSMAYECRCIIHTDSKYCINVIDTWQWKWRANGWISNAGRSIENQDLIRLVQQDFESCKYTPKLVYTPAHSNDQNNDKADQLAKRAVVLDWDPDYSFWEELSDDDD